MESPNDLMVADLIDDNWRWDKEALAQHFTEEDAALVREIPLSERKPVDVQYWWPVKDGVYTTKSGYWLGRLGHLKGWMNRFGGGNGDAWSIIWNLGGPPKLAHFLWRACVAALATRGRLYDRHLLVDGTCAHCAEQSESIVHAICTCSLVAPIWDSSPFHQLIVDCPSSSFVELFMWMHSKLDRSDLLSFASLAWAAWSFRNSVTHAEPWQMPR
ncbi:hypothetical protein BVRB_4g081080 [Beta vulgaris subsp. vulgaris]|nr:hypothetical protein BVRB_4g081080 [Beta vulgaris subsp. vulgaris]